MQSKGIIKFFLVVMTLVCLVQYLLILPTRKVENAADAYSQEVAAQFGDEDQARQAAKEARIAFLDSMSSEEVFSIPLLKSYTYQELKAQQLALGLDLKGGMSMVLQVDLRELLETLSNESKDPTFIEALDNADKALASAQSDYVTLFAQEFQELSEGKKLASIFSRNQGLREEINFETPDAEVISILRRRADETVDLTFKRLKERIDKLGVVQPNVSLDASRDLILLELPGIDNPERARSFVQSTAKLEFRDVYRVSDPGIINSFLEADARLRSVEAGDTVTAEEEPEITYDTLWTQVTDSLGNLTGDSTFEVVQNTVPEDPFANRGPLLQVLNLNIPTQDGTVAFQPAVMGVADKNKMDQIDRLLDRDDIKRLFPQDVIFAWSQKPFKDFNTGKLTNQYQLYALKKRRGSDKAPLEGDRVIRATSQPDPMTNEIVVSLAMDNQGARTWGEMTTRAAQDNNREIAIVLDGEVVSSPRVNEAITTGDSQISGDFSVQEGRDLANILQIGKLPATPKIIQEAVVGPSLGRDNIDRSLKSITIGFGLLLAFMIFYYAGAGIVSIIALFANLFFIFGALASYGTVLTLPGIAGIVLTIGMAVDANVIIYERIREELREGKSLLISIADGFKHSYSAIIDANVTTLLVAFVLAYFGLGPIKGFAVVLIIGVIFSLFTAVLFTRLIIDWWTKNKARNLNFWNNFTKDVFAHLNVDWLGKRKIAYIVSGLIIVAGLASFGLRGFDLGVDFKGGYSYNIEFEDGLNIDAGSLRSGLEEVFGSQPVVKSVDTENTFNVVTDYLIDDDADDAPDRVMEAMHRGVVAATGTDVTLDQFKDSGYGGTHVISSSKVGPTIADDIKTSSVYATIFALLLIFLYIFIRFSKWQYSLGAVAALFHDTIIVLSVFSILWGLVPWTMEIDQPFIAALLTVIGYSINDTVVVFDRIREYLNTYTQKSKTDVINMAVNSTVSRTIITSVTTMLVVLTLFLFGGTSIKGFAFALVIGIIVGTYSSIFVATPIVHDFTGELVAKDTKKKKRFSKAVNV